MAVEVDFAVRAWWGRRLPRVVTIRSWAVVDCGLELHVGERYLVAPSGTTDGAPTAYARDALSIWHGDVPLVLNRLGRGRDPGLLPRYIGPAEAGYESVVWRWAAVYTLLAALLTVGIALALRAGGRRFGRGS